MNQHRNSLDAEIGSGLVGMAVLMVMFLALLAAFLIVVAVVFVVRTFVKYPGKRKTLWIALMVCVASSIGAVFVAKLTTFGAIALVGIGVAVLLITCLAVDLKNRDTLMRENVNLIDEVLHTPWWG
jgi:hypothetical protein